VADVADHVSLTNSVDFILFQRGAQFGLHVASVTYLRSLGHFLFFNEPCEVLRTKSTHSPILATVHGLVDSGGVFFKLILERGYLPCFFIDFHLMTGLC
jgi:hypothetical protein